MQPFINVATTNIGYGPDRQAQYGSRPFVQGFYLQDGMLVQHHNLSVRYDDGNIFIDHGGMATGFILIK